MKQKIIALLCAMTMLACIINVPAAAGAISSQLIATNIPKTFPVVKQDPSATTVNFWHAMSGRYAVLVDNIANWYNATQGAKKKIYVKPIFQGDYNAITIKVSAVVQAGNMKDLPDVLQGSVDSVFAIKDSKHILYMEDLMNADKTFNIKNKLNKNCMWACSYKGKQLGLPFSTSVCVLHYNVNAFKAVGLDPDRPPKTIAELAEATKALVIKGSGKKPLRYGFSKKIVEYQLSNWIPRQKNGTAYQFDNEEGRLGNPTKYLAGSDGTLKAAISEWKKVLDTGACDYLTPSPRANFEQGFAAMYTDSMVQFDTIDQYFDSVAPKDREKKVFEHRMASIPSVNADDAIGSAIGGSALYMFNKGDGVKKNAAWDFVKFISSADVSAYWFVNSGYFPLNNDALNTKYVQDALSKKPAKKALVEILNNSVKYYKFQEPYMPNISVYNNTIGDQIALLAQGKQTVDQTVTYISKNAQGLINNYNKANAKK